MVINGRMEQAFKGIFLECKNVTYTGFSDIHMDSEDCRSKLRETKNLSDRRSALS